MNINRRRKIFNKLPQPFMIKMPGKLGIKENFLKLIKNIYKKTRNSTANIIFTGKTLNASPSRIRKKAKMSTFTTLIQQSTGSPS